MSLWSKVFIFGGSIKIAGQTASLQTTITLPSPNPTWKLFINSQDAPGMQPGAFSVW
jgi:hypothetical protein